MTHPPPRTWQVIPMGLRITIDIFSGRSNPSWEINDPDQVHELLEPCARNRAGLADIGSGFTGLGFRGVQVCLTSDMGYANLPYGFELAGGGAQDPFAGAELAERFAETMPSEASQEGTPEEQAAEYAGDIQKLVREEIGHTVRERLSGALSFPAPEAPKDEELAAQVEEQLLMLDRRTGPCPYDTAEFYPPYWNHPAVQPQNNCYNYAVNYRTDSSAKPGRQHGFVLPPTVTGPEVARGLFKDGLNVWGTCHPPGTNRMVMAMVTGTFPNGVRDFHFYRLHADGTWSHKLAGNMIRRTDQSGQPITNPFTCNRGIYLEWHGFFQSHHTVLII